MVEIELVWLVAGVASAQAASRYSGGVVGGSKPYQKAPKRNTFIRTLPPDRTNYLLDPQIRRLEKDFLEQGGLRERMTRSRLDHRGR